MIKGFTEQTKHLTGYEQDVLLPYVVSGLRTKIGEGNAIKMQAMCDGMKSTGFKVSPARMRKIINHIRRNGLVDRLMASSKGYWIEMNDGRLRDYIAGLRERAGAINNVADALEGQLMNNW